MRVLPALAVLLMVSVGATACGDDGSEGSGDPTTAPTSAPTSTSPTTASSTPTAVPIAADRDAAATAATDFMVAVNTYGPDDLADDGTLPAYRDRVVPLVTDTFRTAFERNLTLAEKSVSEGGYGRSVTLLGEGVASLGQQTAEVLVAGSLETSVDTTDQQPQSFRVQVTVVRADGAWLVDDFAPVTEAGPGLTTASGDRIEDDAAAARAAAVAALPEVLGYDYRSLADDREAALGVLTASYGTDFAATFDGLAAQARSSRAVVDAVTLAAGITTATAERVDILVFLDQTTRTRASRKPTTYRNQVTASMVLVDGVWLVDGLTTT